MSKIFKNLESLKDTNIEDNRESLKGKKMGYQGLLLFLLGVVITSSVLIFTPMLSSLNLSSFGGYVSKSFIIEQLNTLDSLSYEVNVWRYYNKNINDVIAGNKPQLKADSIAIYASQSGQTELSKASIYEDILKEKAIKTTPNREQNLFSQNFFPPVEGSVTTKFEIKINENIKLTTYQPSEVLAINDGTVVATYWSEQEGNVIQIQHANNFMSKYSLVSQISKYVGDKVIGGDIIGYIGTVDLGDIPNTPRTHNLNLELWYDGNRVNPEDYIIFKN